MASIRERKNAGTRRPVYLRKVWSAFCETSSARISGICDFSWGNPENLFRLHDTRQSHQNAHQVNSYDQREKLALPSLVTVSQKEIIKVNTLEEFSGTLIASLTPWLYAIEIEWRGFQQFSVCCSEEHLETQMNITSMMEGREETGTAVGDHEHKICASVQLQSDTPSGLKILLRDEERKLENLKIIYLIRTQDDVIILIFAGSATHNIMLLQ
ncbi:hypothetical protein WN51_09525 [Melipona quadrifasciata]|uniref:Uncharacterized protein n=1 Tax=Melipona quadrifasciata TaxID=166423 RepID=A0A0M9A7P8_9HYME|nr:hypothetical protein WN51_09525 [Melipona quadrifasciata]